MKAYITAPGDHTVGIPDATITLDIDDAGWNLLMDCCDVPSTPDFGEAPSAVDVLRGDLQKCFSGMIGDRVRVDFDCDPVEEDGPEPIAEADYHLLGR